MERARTQLDHHPIRRLNESSQTCHKFCKTRGLYQTSRLEPDNLLHGGVHSTVLVNLTETPLQLKTKTVCLHGFRNPKLKSMKKSHKNLQYTCPCTSRPVPKMDWWNRSQNSFPICRLNTARTQCRTRRLHGHLAQDHDPVLSTRREDRAGSTHNLSDR